MLINRPIIAILIVFFGISQSLLYAKTDPSEEISALRERAESGDQVAQFNFGNKLYEGEGVARDREKALSLFFKSADQGYAPAQHTLGLLFGVTGRDAESTKWFSNAAENGHIKSMFLLGRAYRDGVGVEPDIEKAEVWFTKSAEEGNVKAQNALGYMYFVRGIDEDKDIYFEKARRWLYLAATGGHEQAQYHMGVVYTDGYGVNPDPSEAAKWYLRAAQQDHAQAQYFIGAMYLGGSGVNEDIEEGERWLKRASDQGHSEAAVLLAKIPEIRERTAHAETVAQCSAASYMEYLVGRSAEDWIDMDDAPLKTERAMQWALMLRSFAGQLKSKEWAHSEVQARIDSYMEGMSADDLISHFDQALNDLEHCFELMAETYPGVLREMAEKLRD